MSYSHDGVALRWLSPGAEYRLLRVKEVSSSCFDWSRNSEDQKSTEKPSMRAIRGSKWLLFRFQKATRHLRLPKELHVLLYHLLSTRTLPFWAIFLYIGNLSLGHIKS